MNATASGDHNWYKDAIIYELHVRAFRDSNSDGVGDFRGLTEKLDYLQDLGVTALWLLPFYPSPLRDDGYDIADYRGINPIYGTMRDFRSFLRDAHKRDLRVITELVINHTSDRHHWFQRARRAPKGSSERNFYVWSDDPDKYSEARIIFQDTETSNWTWDPVAGSYYWHRFYSHQPDLNFDNPTVRRSITRLIDYWMRMGVSGMRLDAIPYLFERDDTNCENLPETHQFLRELRSYVDSRYPGRIFISEANQWPEDAVQYFGDGDETHVAFHFPLMPRLFMALQMEDSRPVRDILEQTPRIPESAQWAVFLRNHDELTLEMVTDEERDFMYRMYAHDRDMRINLGIRRRLAPLLNNDRRKIELMHALLFSMPGTPVIYYGDEIGMGDNFYLGDRDAVRTPMQWSPDRNAGFSATSPQKLFLPVVVDYEYHYEAVNVEAQQRNPDSLLWWMRRMIGLRKQHPAFGRGDLEFVRSSNVRVLSFIRCYDGEQILVVANLSRNPQQALLESPSIRDKVPTELQGGSQFPRVTDQPYSLSLGPYGFYWFSLGPLMAEDAGSGTSEDLPTVIVSDRRPSNLFDTAFPPALMRCMVRFLKAQRWFGGKAREIRGVRVRRSIPVRTEAGTVHVLLLTASYREGEPETYFVPLALVEEAPTADLITDSRLAVCWLEFEGTRHGRVLVYDALSRPEFATAVLQSIGSRRIFRDDSGAMLVCTPARAYRQLRSSLGAGVTPQPLGAEQSNTSLVFGSRLTLKFYRRVQPGVNPDLEVSKFLSDEAHFPHIPAVGGSVELIERTGEPPSTVAMLQEFVEAYGDAWAYSLDALSSYRERVNARATGETLAGLPKGSLLELSREPIPEEISDLVGPYLESARMLGQRTGQMHVALASGSNPDFAPERFTRLYQRSLWQSIHNSVRSGLELLASHVGSEAATLSADASELLSAQPRLLRRLDGLLEHRLDARRIRIHGDLHLGQALRTSTDFVFIDFEGEPLRPLTERRIKRSPIRDVAGMLRSFDYAACTAMFADGVSLRPEQREISRHAATLWYRWVAASYLNGYRAEIDGSGLVPTSDDDFNLMLDAFLIQKAVYEVGYEMNNRPEWLHVPVRGLLSLVESW